MVSKIVPVIGVVTVITVAGITASSPAEDQPSQQSPEAEKATVVGVTVKRPPKVVHRTLKIHLNTKPSPAEVVRIINHEAALWGVSAVGLSHRAYCESHYHWWASNGTYQGVLQFGPNAFWRGMRTIGTRRYADTVIRYRRMHSRVYRQWSDGRLTRARGRIVRQRMIVKKVGYIPRQPSLIDAYAQIRIGAQAIKGISAVHSSEWACST